MMSKKWYLASTQGVMNTCSFNEDGTRNQTVDECYSPNDAELLTNFWIRRRYENDVQVWAKCIEYMGESK
jgi:hypothetical protein